MSLFFVFKLETKNLVTDHIESSLGCPLVSFLAIYHIEILIDFLRNKMIEIDLSQRILAGSGKPRAQAKCKNERFYC